MNQQCVVYSFQCDLCDAGYVGYTCRHLHQRIEEHKGSAIGNQLREQHDIELEDIAQNFRILRKCQNKLDCLIFEMLFINRQRNETVAKQTVRFNSRQIICLGNLFFIVPLSFYFMNILSTLFFTYFTTF